MESAPGMDFSLNSQENFKIGYEHLKSIVEYVFKNPKMKHDTWRVSYWSVKIQRSSILKSRAESDIARLHVGKRKTRLDNNVQEQTMEDVKLNVEELRTSVHQ